MKSSEIKNSLPMQKESSTPLMPEVEQQPDGLDRKPTSQGKKVAGILFLLIIVIYLIVDAVAAPCTLIETESERVIRLKKADAPASPRPFCEE